MFGLFAVLAEDRTAVSIIFKEGFFQVGLQFEFLIFVEKIPRLSEILCLLFALLPGIFGKRLLFFAVSRCSALVSAAVLTE